MLNNFRQVGEIRYYSVTVKNVRIEIVLFEEEKGRGQLCCFKMDWDNAGLE